MSKKDDMSCIRDLGLGILDTLNGIKEVATISTDVPENKKAKKANSTDVMKMDDDLKKEVLNDLKDNLTRKISKNKSEELKKQLIKLNYEKQLCLSTNTKYEQKIADKIESKLTLSLNKLTKLQTKLTLVERFLSEL